MSTETRYERHARLVNRMAGALGVDLDEAQQHGRWSPEEMSATVARCTGCTDPCACQAWLAEIEGQTAQAAPGFCRNRDLLHGLRETLVVP